MRPRSWDSSAWDGLVVVYQDWSWFKLGVGTPHSDTSGCGGSHVWITSQPLNANLWLAFRALLCNTRILDCSLQEETGIQKGVICLGKASSLLLGQDNYQKCLIGFFVVVFLNCLDSLQKNWPYRRQEWYSGEGNREGRLTFLFRKNFL